jgi:hypothetical protein
MYRVQLRSEQLMRQIHDEFKLAADQTETECETVQDAGVNESLLNTQHGKPDSEPVRQHPKE